MISIIFYETENTGWMSLRIIASRLLKLEMHIGVSNLSFKYKMISLE